MSDGPHRSLSMRRGWKTVAECASNFAFADEDVRDAIIRALTNDWKKEMSAHFVASILEMLGGKTLYGMDNIRSILDLRQTISGGTMGATLLDFLTISIGEGKSGQAALKDAVTHTLIDQSARCARQIEEHYLRKAGMQDARRVRQCIDEAIQTTDFGSLSIELLDRGSISAHGVRRHDGVDDGVYL